MSTWLRIAEKGSLFGIRFFFFACVLLGRGPARALLKPVVLYYVVFHRDARGASRDYLTRVHGRATFAMIYRHLLNFAEVTLDRVFFLQGKVSRMQFESSGFAHLEKLRSEGRGAVLLGAHVGSFAAMSVLAGHKDVRINMLAHRGNSRMMNSVLEQINPAMNARFIELVPGDLNAILRVKELVEAGELVALMGDRAELDARAVACDFLGAEARFPTGLYALASLLRCPILLTLSLYQSPNRYAFYCEPFAEQVSLPRGERTAALARYAQQYAARLEHFCKLSPESWFNFYDFWSERP